MRIHLCSGSIYLSGYINCDIDGILVNELKGDDYILNPNETTIDRYFVRPFEKDVTKRKRYPTIIDRKMNIMEIWPFGNGSVEEIVMVSCWEHFEHLTEIPHIILEARRVLKFGGVWKFDFPDIRKQVDEWYGKDDEFLAELIYCNRKNMYSKHCWMYTKNTIPNYLIPSEWSVSYEDIVRHDYPMQGVWATKI